MDISDTDQHLSNAIVMSAPTDFAFNEQITDNEYMNKLQLPPTIIK